MAPERRRRLLLAVLAAVLVVATYRAWPGQSGSLPAAPDGRRPAATSAPSGVAQAPPDVHLEELSAERARLGRVRRNLFRFEEREARAVPVSARAPVEVVPSGPPPSPPVAPIPFKFIGIVEAPERSLKVAVLSDGRGVYYGREGEIIEGQYRIIRIGADAVELARLDGSGRQMIRLSGS